MKNRKLIALFLAAAMCLSLLAGCKGKTDPTPTPGGENPPVETGDVEPEVSLAPLTGEAGKYTYRTYSTSLSPNWNQIGRAHV